MALRAALNQRGLAVDDVYTWMPEHRTMDLAGIGSA
jgi:hypothetical protein